MKIIPIASKTNTVVFEDIEIFLRESVGILLTNKKAIIIVR